MTEETYSTIGQMCEEFDVTPRTLRFYESKELLFPRREGSRRLFTRSDRARLVLILRGKRFGFSLEEIRQLLDLYDIGDQQRTQIARTYSVALERLEAMRAQRDELDAAILDLEDQMALARDILKSRGVGVAA
ncbi:MerR family transcriptional regulator [Pontivivens nitratireducens]|uniref:MerR family DNA-binding transcriptional regulator n=1 Tax=Pontivivens nitratireducens TaxID=2758038 RepID=A0A6G7VLQ6_9RHOB|nr:MerR family DNA-binding transcriptional regulator [Pontibrevibacter nitratireducens]QIK40951.1 MerR family DNA-binding transcriptional regulator [Pontibrevibacter nitratireducens]